MIAKVLAANLIGVEEYFKGVSEGYKSWGKVDVVTIVQKINEHSAIAISAPFKSPQVIDLSVKQHAFEIELARRIFVSRKNIQTVFFTRQEYAGQIRAVVPPILDDQAQLLGPTVRFVQLSDDVQKNIIKAKAALNGRFAAVMNNGISICLGANIEEAHVAAQLLEKTSKAFVEAEYLGGAKSINIFEAYAMHYFYLWKYSKESAKNK